jgi:hypothetical protein
MAVAMKLLGLAGAMATPHDEQYVQEYDPSGGSAPDECVLVTTPDITRPLTAFSVTFDPVPNA